MSQHADAAGRARDHTTEHRARAWHDGALSHRRARSHLSTSELSLFVLSTAFPPLLDSFVCTQALGATNNLWLDTRDNVDVPVTWNVDVFVQATKDLVSVCSHFSVAATSS